MSTLNPVVAFSEGKVGKPIEAFIIGYTELVYYADVTEVTATGEPILLYTAVVNGNADNMGKVYLPVNGVVGTDFVTDPTGAYYVPEGESITLKGWFVRCEVK